MNGKILNFSRIAKDVGVEFITMSKAFNMAGWRIGFCAGNPKIVSGLTAGAVKG